LTIIYGSLLLFYHLLMRDDI